MSKYHFDISYIGKSFTPAVSRPLYMLLYFSFSDAAAVLSVLPSLLVGGNVDVACSPGCDDDLYCFFALCLHLSHK